MRARFCALVLAAGALAGCSALPTRDLSSSHEYALSLVRRDVPPPSSTGFSPANATPARRRDTLERVWSVIDDDYFDPTFATIDLPAVKARSRSDLVTVHNDADFYKVLQEAVGAMPDSHTALLTPRQAEEERTQRTTLMGIVFSIVEGRVVIVEVTPGFPADEAGVRAGMLLDAVDDRPIDAQFLAAAAEKASTETPIAPKDPDVPPEIARTAVQLNAVSELLSTEGEEPRAHRLTLRRGDDSVWQATLLAREGDVPTEESLSLRPSGVAVLRLSRFDPSALDALDEDIEHARRVSQALIVDLRKNPGGEVRVFRKLVDHFIDRPQVLGIETWRFWRITVTSEIEGEPVKRPYLKPIAVLIDEATGSAAELTAHALVELRDAIPVGQRTCGCVVGLGREFVLPDGGVLRVAEAAFKSAHGRRMERDPLEPAVTVTPTLAQFRTGEDLAVGAAERALLERLAKAGP